MGCISAKYKIITEEELEDIKEEVKEKVLVDIEKTKDEELDELKKDIKDLKILYNYNITRVETIIKLLEDKDKPRNPFTNFF